MSHTFSSRDSNLSGVLAEEFADLPHLQEIDLSLNYLSGPIPVRWAQRSLVIISLMGNRISGSIPMELGNISTLEQLVLDSNQLRGHLPLELGNLTRLKRFIVSANNLTETIPETFGNLKSLEDFRIDGTNISGKIPDFIGKWTKLERLNMQGTSLEGPFPPTISLLQNLNELMVSDLSGVSNLSFPDLEKLRKLKQLVLRNCLITGQIPNYIGEVMTALEILDLSFNRLSGLIPTNIEELFNKELRYLFLTNNLLTGEIPSWIRANDFYIDVSYNNFTK